MNTRIHLPVLILLFALTCSVQAQPVDTSSTPIAITDISVVDVVEGKIIPDQTVILSGQQITGVGHADSLSVPGHATVIDAKGKYLIPGLWDMHVHIFWDWGPHLLLANGVTGVRVMNGTPERLKEIKKNRNGRYKGLEVEYSSPIVDGQNTWDGSVIAKTPEQGRKIVRQQAAAGYDLIKVYHFLDQKTYHAIAEESIKYQIPFAGHVPIEVTLEEAVGAGQRSIEHNSGLLEYLISNRDHFYKVIRGERLDTSIVDRPGAFNMYKWQRYLVENYQFDKLKELANLLSKKWIWVTPTLVSLRAMAYENNADFRDDQRKNYLPEEELEAWESGEEFPDEFNNISDEHYQILRKIFSIQMDMIRALSNGGVQFLAGTDIGIKYLYPGFSLHDELALFVEAGLTPAEALRTATINSAEYLGREYNMGSIAVDHIANLVLLEDNPLEDINNVRKIHAVVVKGKLLDRPTLDSMLNEVKTKVQKYKKRDKDNN